MLPFSIGCSGMWKTGAFSCGLRVALILAVAGMLSSTVSGESTGQCQAQWKMVRRQANRLSVPVKDTIEYTMGIIETEETASSSSDSQTSAAELKAEFSGISASYTNSKTHTVVNSHLRGSQLAKSYKRTMELTMPPGTVYAVWQLHAQYRSYSIGFADTEILDGSAPPPSVVDISCAMERRTQAVVISNWTPVRLRHKLTGQYLVAIRRKGWEAATLGNSRDYHFRLERASDGVHVRIVRIEPMFSRYKYAYSSNVGGIYFDKFRSQWNSDSGGQTQQWRMSIDSPVDGDAVTFRNRNWPEAGLVYHDGSATNVYCLSRRYRTHDRLDEWIIEVVQ